MKWDEEESKHKLTLTLGTVALDLGETLMSFRTGVATADQYWESAFCNPGPLDVCYPVCARPMGLYDQAHPLRVC